MHTTLAMLLVSTLTTTGLLALWAATSRRHWFVRTAAFLAVLSPLLLVPAYEPFVALVTEGAVIVVGVQLGRWLSRKRVEIVLQAATIEARRREPLYDRLRFSLTTLFLLTVVIGFGAAVAARLPALNRYAWQSVAIIGVCSGLATLLGYWAATRSGLRKLPAAIAACLAGLALSAAPAWWDWFVPSFAGLDADWPPTPPDPSDPFGNILHPFNRPSVAWFMATPAIVAVTILLASLVVIRSRLRTNESSGRPRRFAKGFTTIAVLALTALLLGPSLAILYRMLIPDPIPIINLPSPNGYDDLMAAGRLVEKSSLATGKVDYATATQAQLAAAVAEVIPGLEMVRRGLKSPCVAPLDYRSQDLNMTGLQGSRAVARALAAAGRLADLEGRPGEALKCYLDDVRLGFATRRGGLIVDGMVGIAITGVGARGVYDVRAKLTRDQSQAAIQQIDELMHDAEPYGEFDRRDRVWSQHAVGWPGRLNLWLTDVCGDSESIIKTMFWAWGGNSYEGPWLKEQADLGLLKTELAVQAYRAKYGFSPESASALVPEFLTGVPLDPFNGAGGNIRYKRTADGYLLYSLGPNGVDDGGAKPDADDLLGTQTGDLRLDVLYAPETSDAGADTASRQSQPQSGASQ